MASGRYYSEAVAWAYEAEIAKGISTTAFAPNAAVTREQLVTFLARYAKYQGADVSTQGALTGYPDAKTVSDFALASMTWAVEQGLIQGIDGNLVPAAPQPGLRLPPSSSATIRFIANNRTPGPVANATGPFAGDTKMWYSNDRIRRSFLTILPPAVGADLCVRPAETPCNSLPRSANSQCLPRADT